MLIHLSIHNYILIQELDVDIKPGLTIITGETGAGKSILLGALGLLMGQRADSSAVADPSAKCVVEGTFDLSGRSMQPFFQANDMDYADHTIIRREVHADGKSRAFVNDSPVNLNTLKALGSLLIDIHSQQEHLYLSDSRFQRHIVDHFARQQEAVASFGAAYRAYRKALEAVRTAEETLNRQRQEADYISFQYQQLSDAQLDKLNQPELEQELQTLSHTEEIKSALQEISVTLHGEEDAVIHRLKRVMHVAEHLQTVYPSAKEYVTRLKQAYIDLKDLAEDAEGQNEHIEFLPDRLTEVEEQLNRIYQLEQKHRVASVEELIDLRNSLQAKLQRLEHADDDLERQRQATEAMLADLQTRARELTEARRKAIPPIERHVGEILRQVGIPHGQFRIVMTPSDALHDDGQDDMDFLFSANGQQVLRPIGKVASGGELSRLMLSIKSVIAQTVTLPTLIFDEIDTGVSGEIADKMGNIIVWMSQFVQIINITHLPQVAAKGEQHLLVYKTDEGHTAHTHIKVLNRDERVQVIAGMLSGEHVTDAALTHARILLGDTLF